MCGISGFVRRRSDWTADAMTEVAGAMSDALVHRGPDDGGVWVDAAAGVGLSHRRLSILDLSRDGAQPMTSGCGRYTIVYNGETYNFTALRQELEAEGIRFRGHSDTEVVLAAIGRWDVVGALERFNGMFAFALWDGRERALTLARDRAGKKPLYYGWWGDTFLFASELKALRRHPEFTAEIDRDGVAAMLRYHALPGPGTIYRGIHKLDPGTFLRVDARGQREPEVYWSARDMAERCASQPFDGCFDDAVERLEALLLDAVQMRMVSDVPLGALLSGGVDSSVVVALMQRLSSRPIRTFAIGFREPKYDEAYHAKTVAEHLGTDHAELYVTPKEAQAVLPKFPTLYDEPFADISQLPTFLVSELARRDVTVALSGDGGDELFLGYNRYFRSKRRWKSLRLWPMGLRSVAASLARSTDAACWKAYGERSALSHPGALRARPTWSAKLARQAERLTIRSATEMSVRLLGYRWALELVPGAQETWTIADDPSAWPRMPDDLQAMGAIDYVTYLRDDILVKVDRASMGVSLEVRCPILDHRVSEFAWNLPTEYKIRGKEGKVVLRRLLDRYVPAALTHRPKQGFRVPIGDWLIGELRDWTEDLLDEKRIRDEGILDPEGVRRVWQQHRSGWATHTSLLWSILMFRAWNEAQSA